MDTNAIAFDFETIGNKFVIPFLPPVEVDSKLKDPVKIDADLAKKKVKQIEKLGLNPWTNVICAVGWCDGKESGHIMLEDETSEKDLLYKIWDLLARYDHYATFNGIGFDVPVLNAHSLIHRIRMGTKINLKKYQIGNHSDLRMILGNWDSKAPGKLDFFLKLFFGQGKEEGIDGSLVQGFWDDGRFDEIGKYAERDGVDTWKLYELMGKYYI